MLKDSVLEPDPKQTALKSSALSERRAWVRQPCELDSLCKPLAGGSSLQWLGKIRDLSAGGIALNLSRRFGSGTVLTIDMHSRDKRVVQTLTARVVHSTLQEDGSWLIGCAFTSPLNEEDLKALL
jgi:hypothetical protein